jgi:hypothetical protein
MSTIRHHCDYPHEHHPQADFHRMNPFDRLPIGQRIIIAIVIVTAVLIALFIISRILGYGGAEAQNQALAPTPYDARLLELDRQAIETAYQDKVQHLFEIWLQDPTGQPQRALVGVASARKAYIGAMTAIELRQKQLTPLPQPRPQEAPK